jgi:hypothetical protein
MWIESLVLLIFCAAAVAVLGPQCRCANTNPPPAYPRPPAPPAPPTVRNYRRTKEVDMLTITKSQLEAALLRWTQDARDGKTRTVEETGELSVQQVAEESAAHLWEVLQAEGGVPGLDGGDADAQRKLSAYLMALHLKVRPQWIPAEVQTRWEDFGASAPSAAGVPEGVHQCEGGEWGMIVVRDRDGHPARLRLEDCVVLSWRLNPHSQAAALADAPVKV